MVLEVLSKTDHPLMAKEIVRKVNDSFNNYKISKSDVKNVLWKELKTFIIFDKVNFKYSLKTNVGINDRVENNTSPNLEIKYNISSNSAKEFTSEIDGHNLIIEIVSQKNAPLFWTSGIGLTTKVFLNELHPNFNLFETENFIKILIALVRTSLSFSDKNGEIFLNRFKNYFELI